MLDLYSSYFFGYVVKNNMSPYFFAGLSAIFAALMTIVGKIGLSKVDSTLATGVRSFVMFLFMAVVIGATGKWKDIGDLSSKSFWFIVVSAVFGASSWMMYFIALQNGNASRVSAIDRMSIVAVVLFSAVFLQDSLTARSLIGTAMAGIGLVLIAWK